MCVHTHTYIHRYAMLFVMPISVANFVSKTLMCDKVSDEVTRQVTEKSFTLTTELLSLILSRRRSLLHFCFYWTVRSPIRRGSLDSCVT